MEKPMEKPTTGTTDLNMVNAYIPGRADVGPVTAAMIARRDALLGPAYRLMYEHPLHIVRGEGVWLIDPEGRRYLDVYNNVASLGHCHPAVAEAIRSQVQTLATNTRYLHDTILELAERLLATVPETELAHLMLTCTGSEANDVAYRIAKVRTGGTGVIVTETAYHGFTDAVSQFSPSLGATVDLGAHVRLVPAPRLYHAEGADLSERFTRDVEAAIADLRRHGIKPAALIVDSLFTSDGILPGPAGFLKGAVDAIKRAGGIFIADEVQPGFGRTGEHMWGFQRHGVIPDIVTLGKPMGNGQPVAGLLATADVLAEFGKNSRYFNTFAGNTVSCAAALAVLDTIEKEGLVQHAAKVGKILRDGIAELANRHEAIGDVRGAGMFVGVELVSDRASRAPDRALTSRVVNRMRDKGVLLSACAMGHNVLKIRPPLVLSAEQAGMVIETLDEALTAAQSTKPG
jgi:4-aminobutyrate aminotransferase-like enzyme